MSRHEIIHCRACGSPIPRFVLKNVSEISGIDADPLDLYCQSQQCLQLAVNVFLRLARAAIRLGATNT